jgi:excisionase family DNA binding protein
MQKEVSLLRVNDFAALLNVTPACVRRWLLERKINSVRIGRLVRIPRAEVSRLVERGLRPAREPRDA